MQIYDTKPVKDAASGVFGSLTPIRVLDDRDLAAVLAAADDARELALLSLLSATGLRMIEVPRLEIDGWVRRTDGSALLYVPPGTLHMGRMMYVPTCAAIRLDAYLADPDRVVGDHEPIFLGDEGRALTAAETGLIVLHAIARAGLDSQAFVRVEGPQLRIADVLSMTFAYRFLRAGGELQALRKCLGHRDLNETRQLASHLASAARYSSPEAKTPR